MDSQQIKIESNTKSRLEKDKIQQIVYHNFGKACQLVQCDELTDGMFNAIYALTFCGANADGYKELVLKIGVHPDKYILTYENDIMNTEVFVYEQLKNTKVPVPKIIRSDFSKLVIDCPYFFMEKLNGTPWNKLADTLTNENKAQLDFDLGRAVAEIHTFKGDYFGYIREDEKLHYTTWGEAYKNMLETTLKDADNAGITSVPKKEIKEILQKCSSLLNEISQPVLTNFDITGKNILLTKQNNFYTIEGIIDHERAFYGDPYADFLSLENIVGPIEKADDFIRGYNNFAQKPLEFTTRHKIRHHLYRIYMGVIQCAEIYRFDIPMIKQATLSYGEKKIWDATNEIKKLIAEINI